MSINKMSISKEIDRVILPTIIIILAGLMFWFASETLKTQDNTTSYTLVSSDETRLLDTCFGKEHNYICDNY